MLLTSYPEFFTATCLNWQPLLADSSRKDIIVESLRFIARDNRVVVYAFVIMTNHIHIIWQMVEGHERQNVQRDFLRYTGQSILKTFRNENSSFNDILIVEAKDRRRQVWERNSLSIELWTPSVFEQKLNYIHENPVRAGLCRCAEDYKYSSARYYLMNEESWDFLTDAGR
jgi:REP element-mobilizing transposase RayT